MATLFVSPLVAPEPCKGGGPTSESSSWFEPWPGIGVDVGNAGANPSQWEETALKPRTVADLMSRDPATLGRNDELGLADDIMKLGRIRHLPVVDDDKKVAGVISQRDLYHSALVRALGHGSHAVGKVLQTLFVKEVMYESPITISPDAPISEAARLMTKNKIGCLLVVESEGTLVGILTEGDFVAHFAAS